MKTPTVLLFNPRLVSIAWALLVGGIFLFDVVTPLGYTAPILYLLPLALAGHRPHRWNCRAVAVGLIALTWIGFIFCPGDLVLPALFNRTLLTAAFLAVAIARERYQFMAQVTASAVRESEQTASRVTRLNQLSAWSLTLSGEPDAVFEQATRLLGEMFGVRVVCLSEIVGEELHFKSVSLNGQVVRDAGRCPLRLTPCATVETTKDLCVFDRVMERFPDATLLRDHRAVAYCGVPSLDSRGQVVAVTCLLDDKPRDWSEEEQELLRIFGQRIAAELERARHLAAREEAEDRLRRSEAFVNSVIDHLPNMVFVKDARDLRFVRFNKAGEDLLGRAQAELLGKNDYDFFPKDEADFFTAKDREVLASGRLLDIPEESIHTPSGIRLLHTKKVPVCGPDGTPQYLLGIAEDVTEQKHTAAALRLSEERFHAFMNHSPAVAFMKDEVGRHVYVNATFERRFNLSPGTVIGKSDDEFFPEPVAATLRANDLEVLSSGRPLEIEETVPTPDGTAEHWLVLKFPIGDAAGRRFVGGVAVDITERKRAEAAWQEQLCLSSLSAHLHAVLVHEGPLDAMLGQCAELLARHLDLALARIWLLGPGDRCDGCWKAADCIDRESCLHLEASKGLSQNLDGEYSRIPLGALKIGRVAAGAGPVWTNDVLGDDRLPNKQWMKDNGLRAFAGFPLLVNGQVVGVLAVFARAPLSDATLRALEMAAKTMSLGVVRKRAEAALKESEERYALVVQGTNDGIWDWNIQTGHDYLSPRWKEILGYRDDELADAQASFFDRVHLDDAQRVREALARHLEGQAPYAEELRLRCKDGGYRWVLARGKCVRDGEGRPLRMAGSITDITERKRMEEALRESHAELERRVMERTAALSDANIALTREIAERKQAEDRLRTTQYAVDHAADQIFVIGPDGYFLDVNESACRRLGYTKEELLTMSVMDIDPDFPATTWAAFWAEFRTSKLIHLETRHRSKSGEIYPVEVMANYLWHNGREFDYAIVRDITERKRAEEALRASEERYRLAEAGTNDGLWDWNVLTNDHYLSPRWKELLGYRDDELPNHVGSFIRLLHPDDSDRVRQAMEDHLIRHVPFDLEFRLRHKDGAYRWFRSRGQAVWNERGQPVRMTGSITDITERKEAEQALLESRQRFELISQGTQDTVWDWDLATNRVWWSQGIETQWGFTKDQIRPTADWWAERIHPEDRERVVASIRGALEGTDTVWSGEYRYRRADGSYAFVLDRGYVMRNSDGRAIRMIGVEIDVTNAKMAEEVRRRQEVKERLLEERETVVRNLHDGVLQSLYAVRLGLEHGRRLFKVRPEQVCEHLERQIGDVGLAIAEMRRFLAGHGPTGAKAGDLRHGLEELVRLYRSTSPLEWELLAPDHLGDLGLLPQEETGHLLYIAREAMSNVARHASAKSCRIVVDQAGDRLRLAIEDDGVGFQRGAARRKGRGLGNMEARARQIGATITVKSAPGVGTCVTVDLMRREVHVAT